MWPLIVYIGMLCILLGNYLLAKKSKNGWKALLIGNTLVILYFIFYTFDIHMIIINSGYALLAVYGIFNWSRK